MSPNMKLSVLALVGAAAAVPQYGHGHGHKHYTPSGNSGHAYPTGGWGNGYNATKPSAVAQGTGSSSQPAGEQTTDSDYTVTSMTTSTVFLTEYPSSASAAATDVQIKDVTSSEESCGQTVYVTQTNKVTVTVSAGGASAPASSAAAQAPSSGSGYQAAQPSAPSSAGQASVPAAQPSSAAPVASAPEASYEAASSFVLASSVVSKGQETPASSAAAATSSAAYVEDVTSVAQASYSAAASSAASASSAAASSASPSASSTASYSGGKRGLAYRYDGAADCKSFEGQNFGFVWNWESTTKGDVGSFAANFIPTLRTLDNAGDWATNAQAAIDAGSKVVFGFNEPDMPSQANLGVSDLCDAWKANMNQFSGKATVVGPSVSSSETEGQGLSYLSEFVKQCPGAKFDDINIHWYGPSSAGFDAFKSHYESAKSQFSGKQIWVSEFGLTGATAKESADFLKSAQEYLDGEDTCAGYSYFAVGTFDPASNLLGTYTNLSEAGKIYVA